MSQERGYKSRAVIDFESSFKTAPANSTAHLMPFNTNSLGGSRELNTAQTITGTRNPVAPFGGDIDCAGDVVVPVDAHNFVLWLKTMFGAPSTTQVGQLNLNAADAVDKGNGKVGIPSTGHGLAVNAPIVIGGTLNYDGPYTLDADTSADELVITATYASETFSTDDTVDLAHQLNADASAASDIGGGLVGIPCAGHGLPVGAEVVVAGSTNYNGTFTVKRGTTSSVIYITDTYVAETFDGSETITAYFQDHVFVVGDSMPSFLLEKQFPTVGEYLRSKGVKVGSFSLDLGGSDELTASLSLLGANESMESSVYDAAPVSFPFHRFENFQAAITENGSALSSRIKSVGFKIDFGLDGDQYTIGDQGERGDIPEGIMGVSGNVEALFTDDTFLTKAINSTESSMVAVLTNGGYKLTLAVDELKYQRTSPPVSGPNGVVESFDFQGFHDDGSAESAFRATLRSELKDLTE